MHVAWPVMRDETDDERPPAANVVSDGFHHEGIATFVDACAGVVHPALSACLITAPTGDKESSGIVRIPRRTSFGSTMESVRIEGTDGIGHGSGHGGGAGAGGGGNSGTSGLPAATVCDTEAAFASALVSIAFAIIDESMCLACHKR